MKSLFYACTILLCLCSTALVAQSGACSLNEQLPFGIPDGFTHSLNLIVNGAANPVLNENGQGICAVRIAFKHEYLGDLNMRLVSPGGQSVQLIGFTGFFGNTDFTTWDVRFVPCNSQAMPDPGFSPQWSNNQVWGLGNHYSGSYHPFQGCLEELTGSVDGIWKLVITDTMFIDIGDLLTFSIDFCDPAGLTCTGCAADAGELTQPNMDLCMGDPWQIYPTYESGITPPTNEYSYLYLISNSTDGVILDYTENVDLDTMGPGTYTACGMSYRTSEAASIPAPNGSLTIAQLRTQLSGNSPAFCGDITNNCVNVVIQQPPPDTVIVATICNSECFFFYGNYYCTPGTVVIICFPPVGCPFEATIHLTIQQPPILQLRDTICAGSCTTIPGFSACTTGVYQTVWPGATSYACDTTVNLLLIALDPVANILAPSTVLSCDNSVLTLNSAPSPGLKTWKNLDTGASHNGSSWVATTPGLYELTTRVVDDGMVLCTKSDTVAITQNIPSIETSQVVQPSGGQQNGSIHIDVSNTDSTTAYAWYHDGVYFAGTEDVSGLGPGSYQCIVSAPAGCADTATFTLTTNFTDGGYTAVSLPGIRSNPGSVPVLVPFQGSLPDCRLRVYDGAGRLVWEQEVAEGTAEQPIDLRAHPDGLYFLEMRVREGRPEWWKLVVQR